MKTVCPTCSKPPAQEYAPFCSRRCADIDLQRWLAGAYVVPGSDDPDLDAEPSRPVDPSSGQG